MNFERLQFHENKLPTFKENKAKDIYNFGDDNLYPELLVELFSKSPKHNAIVSSKASYVAGVGTAVIAEDTANIAKAEAKLKSINTYESFEEVKQKIAYDLELFNGFAIEVIWNRAKTAIAELYHLPFKNVRVGLDDCYYYCEDWSSRKEEVIHYNSFNETTRESKQLFYYKMYRPGQGIYPLPDYVGALKYIEIDTEISNWHLNSIKNGFSAQTLIQMFKGVPTPEEARKAKRRFKESYQGTDNAGGLILMYNEQNERESIVSNLQPSDFDKQFDILNKTVQQEIFVGHKVNSPMLFGVRVESQLGGRSELIEAYEMFQQAYVEPRQHKMDEQLTYLFTFIAPVKLETINKPPLGLDYLDLYTRNLITNEEARKELGLPELSTVKIQSNLNDAINSLSPLVANNVLSNMTINEKRQLAGLPPIANGDSLGQSSAVAMSKENPFGWNDERDLKVFAEFGEDASLFEVVKMSFATDIEKAVLNTIKENKGITIGEVVNIIDADLLKVSQAIDNLSKTGLIEPAEGGVTITEKGLKEIADIQTELLVRYQYEKAPNTKGDILIPTSREFCRNVVDANRVYSREDINAMSAILGYDVWKRRGGWYTIPDSEPAIHRPSCRHIWASKVVRRRK
jgi:predicted transcriptional regulator